MYYIILDCYLLFTSGDSVFIIKTAPKRNGDVVYMATRLRPVIEHTVFENNNSIYWTSSLTPSGKRGLRIFICHTCQYFQATWRQPTALNVHFGRASDVRPAVPHYPKEKNENLEI